MAFCGFVSSFLFLKLKYVTIYFCSITETYVRILKSIKKIQKTKKNTWYHNKSCLSIQTDKNDEFKITFWKSKIHNR